MSALKTVLIADDDELTQALVAEVVRPLGHEVLFASTGEEAIAKAGSIVRTSPSSTYSCREATGSLCAASCGSARSCTA